MSLFGEIRSIVHSGGKQLEKDALTAFIVQAPTCSEEELEAVRTYMMSSKELATGARETTEHCMRFPNSICVNANISEEKAIFLVREGRLFGAFDSMVWKQLYILNCWLAVMGFRIEVDPKKWSVTIVEDVVGGMLRVRFHLKDYTFRKLERFPNSENIRAQLPDFEKHLPPDELPIAVRAQV